MALKDDRRALMALTKRYGFVLQRQTKHYVFKHEASGKILVCGKSISDRRGLKNVEAQIKRVLLSQ